STCNTKSAPTSRCISKRFAKKRRSKKSNAVEPYSPPKYFQIRQDIIAMVRGGGLSPGSPVPSENEIIEKYRVSNTTARKALHELEKEGWVTRVKGKGTFVRDYTVLR